MNKLKLTLRQKQFAEQCLLIHAHNCRTDAYIAIYKPKGTRRTATASASRIYNKPAVQAYVSELRAISAQRAVKREEVERQAWLAQFKMQTMKKYKN